ncbi:acyl-CoA dehydrogenase [Sphaerisporangium flaviroseum]|uniref:Acyl-CoA dehydrogenase n=1 Tax=Sphaerisporangium flaviroseum TaxID=509199 RepID=A0ABP7IEK4_9ACTN
MKEPIGEAMATAALLDQALGDPLDEQSAASFSAGVTTDREGRFPQHLCSAAFEWGLAEYLIPAGSGGGLRSLEQCLALFRVLARRDVTAATAIAASFLASLPVWLEGTPGQRRAVAGLLRGHRFLAFAIGGDDHGADILTGTDAARGTGHAWSLHGSTPLIDNGGHAAAATVLARTGNGGDLTTFLLTPSSGSGGHWGSLPKHETHGLRATALSHLTLSGFPAGDAEVVGRPGQALDTVLHTLPVARMLVAGLALGGLDTCLRAVVSFARSRRLYGRAIMELEPVACRLVDVYTDLLIAEAVSHELCRTARMSPHRFPLMSACVKELVPRLATDGVESLAIVLGARAYCSTEHWHGIVEKMRRDCAVVTVLLDEDRLPAPGATRAATELGALPPDPFAPSPPEPAWTGRLPAGAEAGLSADDDAGQSGVAVAARLLRDEGAPEPYGRRLLELLGRFEEMAAQADEVALAAGEPDWHRGGDAHDLAERHAHLHAAEACAWTWVRRRREPAEEFHASGAWLVLCLQRLARLMGAHRPQDDAGSGDLRRAAMARLERAYDERHLFSDIEVPLT